jgi:uncharacterized protein YbdZ (MbtH family)
LDWLGDLVSIKPFDEENGSFFILANYQEQHRLWPTFAEIPAGWRVVFGEMDTAACLDYTEQNSPYMQRKRLCEKLARGQGPDR